MRRIRKQSEYVPGRFIVNRIVRPRMACSGCDCFTQAPLPLRPIERGRPGPGLLAHVLVNKYADHLPLYRQSQIFERDGLDLARSTLADWVGKATALLKPLADAIGRHVLAGQAIFADDTPVAMLAPGTGKTQTARLWAYGRDERPWGSAIPPARLAIVLGPMADYGSISVLLRPQRRTSEGSPRQIQWLDARPLSWFARKPLPANGWLCRVRGPVSLRQYLRSRLHGSCQAQVRPLPGM